MKTSYRGNLVWGMKLGAKVGGSLGLVILVSATLLGDAAGLEPLSPFASALAYLVFGMVAGLIVGGLRKWMTSPPKQSVVGFLAFYPFALFFAFVTQQPISNLGALIIGTVFSIVVGGIGGPLFHSLGHTIKGKE